MKTTFFITLVFLFYNMTSCAQTRFTEGVSTIGNQKFDITKSSLTVNNKRSWFVSSQKNKYQGPIPLPKDNYDMPVSKSDIHVDLDKVRSIVYQFLNNKKQELHNKNEKLGMAFKFETNGSLVYVSYTLFEDTIITLADLEQIDTALRQEIKATFSGQSYDHYIAVDYNFPRITF
ncbi:hypothetical protein AAFN85_01595 [Mucilaginibacter sp. CAU 1740]|uniref:hypothetical protein n=1 Tax=Mucilaginibacter sp. CAU 1740 TaxID=3140365 RepID=UPI00325C00D2